MHGLTVVFDLDGTLIDTAPDLVHAANHVLAISALDPVEEAEIRPYVSFGGRRMIERGMELRGAQPTEAQLDHLFEQFLTHYGERIAVSSRPFPQLPETLEDLIGAGATLAVCTNKRESLSRKLLQELGLADRFRAICGRDTFAVCKPHPDHLTGTIVRAGGAPQRAVMIGDSLTDVTTARAAGIPIIGVSFGYTDVDMRSLEPDVVIDHYAEFSAALAQLL